MALDLSRVGKRIELKARREPYWQRLRAGCFLGFRPSKAGGAGTWIARVYDSDSGKYQLKSLGDFGALPPNERFASARKAAEAVAVLLEAGGEVRRNIETVADACRDYLRINHNKIAEGVLNHQLTGKVSEAKLELLRRTRSETENVLLLIVDRWPVDLITKGDLLTVLDGDCPSGAALRHAFDRAGIVKVKDLMETSEFGTRAKSSVFALRNHDDWKSAAAPKIRNELKRCDLDTKLSALFGGDDPEQDWMAEYINHPKQRGG